MITTGAFYTEKKKGYNSKTIQCVEGAMNKLDIIGNNPLLMLGQIQSGKTRSFIGLMALAFDNKYDLAIVLTKSSNPLVKQTFSRMQSEFKLFQDNNLLETFDVMSMPPTLTRFQLNKKIILIAKKEKNNLDRVYDFITKYYSNRQSNILIIDDEADFYSVGYKKNKKSNTIEPRAIMSKINSLRESLPSNLECKYVQVTATPQSLFLQPEANNIPTLAPLHPAETVLVPAGDGYIGGNFYFSDTYYKVNQYLFSLINANELSIIKRPDRRRLKIENVLDYPLVIPGMVNAIVDFIVGSCIRFVQNGFTYPSIPCGKDNEFSFIVHTEVQQASHEYQSKIVQAIIGKLKEEVINNTALAQTIFFDSFNRLKVSVLAYYTEFPKEALPLPNENDVQAYFKAVLLEEYVGIQIVNSNNDIEALLDDKGQLKLANPLNIFVGGQVLDRGITIEHLIGFYYGRNPQRVQQDSMLQHSRMYGYRSKADLSVTRCHTTSRIYSRLKSVDAFDRQLREDFEKGLLNNGIVFLGRDQGNDIVPCAPNKVLASNTRILKPGSVALPIGFDTYSPSKTRPFLSHIDKYVFGKIGKTDGTFIASTTDAEQILSDVFSILQSELDDCMEIKVAQSLVKYLSQKNNQVHFYIATGRTMSKFKISSGTYSDSPYTSSGDLNKCRTMAIDNPAIMLLKQKGATAQGWKGSEFYWPVIVVPQNIQSVIFTSDLIN